MRQVSPDLEMIFKKVIAEWDFYLNWFFIHLLICFVHFKELFYFYFFY